MPKHAAYISRYNLNHNKPVLCFDRSHPVVFVNNTVIYLVNNTTYIGNNTKNSATRFGSVEPSSGQIQDTVLVHSASAYTMAVFLNLCETAAW